VKNKKYKKKFLATPSGLQPPPPNRGEIRSLIGELPRRIAGVRGCKNILHHKFLKYK